MRAAPIMNSANPSGLNFLGIFRSASSTRRSGGRVMMITSPSLPNSFAITASCIVTRRPPSERRKRSGGMIVQMFQSDQKIASLSGVPTMSA